MWATDPKILPSLLSPLCSPSVQSATNVEPVLHVLFHRVWALRGGLLLFLYGCLCLAWCAVVTQALHVNPFTEAQEGDYTCLLYLCQSRPEARGTHFTGITAYIQSQPLQLFMSLFHSFITYFIYILLLENQDHTKYSSSFYCLFIIYLIYWRFNQRWNTGFLEQLRRKCFSLNSRVI